MVALKRDTVQRTIDTIGNRIDQLGLAEKSVQQYGQRGRGLRNAGAVAGRGRSGAGEGLIGTAAVLEIDRSQGRALSPARMPRWRSTAAFCR